jgi:glucose-1-phosphate adenylyltransferase
LKDYYQVNIETAQGGPSASLLGYERPVYTKPNFLPPSTFFGNTTIERSIVSDGCVIKNGATILDSIVGPCAVIAEDVTLEGVVFVGRDEMLKRAGSAMPDIGKGSNLRKCIVDSDAMIGADVSILNESDIQELDCSDQGYVISEGIVTILGGACIPDGFKI